MRPDERTQEQLLKRSRTSDSRPAHAAAAPRATRPRVPPSNRFETAAGSAGEDALFRRAAAGDERARRALIERLLPLATCVARRFAGSGEPLEDLVQVASLGLVKAVDRFDPTRGCAFSSFAVPTIAGELKRHFRDRTWVVRPPRATQELALAIDRVASGRSERGRRAPTVAQLAAALSRDEEQIVEALRARRARSALSLQAPAVDERRAALEDELGAIDEAFEHSESRALVEALTARVPTCDREILRMRFHDDMTQQEIANRLQVSQMHVSRRLRAALERLRHIGEHHQRSVEQRLQAASGMRRHQPARAA